MSCSCSCHRGDETLCDGCCDGPGHLDGDVTMQIPSRMDLIGRRIDGVSFRDDADGDAWTILTLDNGQELHILDETPWLIVDPEVM